MKPNLNMTAYHRIGKPVDLTITDDEKSGVAASYRSVARGEPGPSATHESIGTNRFRPSQVILATTAALLFLSVWILGCPGLSCACLYNQITATSFTARSLPHHARAATASLLEVFQVYPPVLTVTPDGILEITDGSSNATVGIIDDNRPTCQELLVTYSFANSYGAPFVGNYTPPQCAFNRVTWNLTVTSAGKQYDRLGIVYLGDIEVFRTSTAEPTAGGIEWTYLKDMTNFLPLLRVDQKIIFDLGNLLSSTSGLTAAYNVTLTAAFFSADDSITPADLILPVSARQSTENMPSVYTVLPDTASNNLTLPRNVKRAVFTVAATGQSDEEFWWSNVLQPETDTFPSYGTLFGYSPFREVQLFIDDMLAGVAWPFPIIFTGGVVPGLWRPIVGIDAFDLKEDEIDITPWLPLLCDGNAHNFTIRVSGLTDNGNGTASLSETTDSYWLVTGKVFIWLDAAGHVTTGSGPHRVTPSPSFEVSSSIGTTPNGTNETLLYSVSAQRSIFFQSTFNLSSGSQSTFWRQTLSYSNYGNYTEGGNVEINQQQTTGFDISSSGYARHISYPLYALSVYSTFGDNFSIAATVNRGKTVNTVGQPVFPTGLESFADAEIVHPMYPQFDGASLINTQNGTATYIANSTSLASFSFGTTEQDMVFAGVEVDAQRNAQGFPSITASDELFHRYVMAVNSTIVEDEETLIDTEVGHAYGPPASGRGFTLTNIPGRGGSWSGTRFGRRV